MMRLLFLCLLLLRAAVSEEKEGSGDVDTDDEDLVSAVTTKLDSGRSLGNIPPVAGETKVEGDDTNKLTVIIIVVAATVLTLSVVATVTTFLVRRHMHKRQQGIYSVPTEQDKKGAI